MSGREDRAGLVHRALDAERAAARSARPNGPHEQRVAQRVAESAPAPGRGSQREDLPPRRREPDRGNRQPRDEVARGRRGLEPVQPVREPPPGELAERRRRVGDAFDQAERERGRPAEGEHEHAAAAR